MVIKAKEQIAELKVLNEFLGKIQERISHWVYLPNCGEHAEWNFELNDRMRGLVSDIAGVIDCASGIMPEPAFKRALEALVNADPSEELRVRGVTKKDKLKE